MWNELKNKKGNDYYFSNGKGYGITSTELVFSFDIEDYNKIKNYTWYQFNKGENGIYYIGDKNGKALHTIIMNTPNGFEVDHIDLNPLNNCKCNLRIVTHQQNQFNQPLQKNNTSGYFGVRYYSLRKKYAARIKFNQRDIHLGYYKSKIEAAQARNVATRLLFGEYGRYNETPPTPKWIKQLVIDKCSQIHNESAAFSYVKEGLHV